MLERGTALALGPLTRDGANSLLQLGDIPITTIALNQADGEAALPWNVIVFTLAVESEAQQIAAAAMRDIARRPRGGPSPAPSSSTAPRRSAGAARRFPRDLAQPRRRGAGAAGAGGKRALQVPRRGQAEKGDLYFLSMGADLARPVRTIIGRGLPVYGTSLLSVGGVESGSARAGTRRRPAAGDARRDPAQLRRNARLPAGAGRSSRWRCSGSIRSVSTPSALPGPCSPAGPPSISTASPAGFATTAAQPQIERLPRSRSIATACRAAPRRDDRRPPAPSARVDAERTRAPAGSGRTRLRRRQRPLQGRRTRSGDARRRGAGLRRGPVARVARLRRRGASVDHRKQQRLIARRIASC